LELNSLENIHIAIIGHHLLSTYSVSSKVPLDFCGMFYGTDGKIVIQKGEGGRDIA
jgi:hypothetical protein